MAETKPVTSNKYVRITLETLVVLLLLSVLYLSSLYNYLLFHSLAEIFSIVIAFGVFMIAWNSRRLLDNNYLLLIGIASLFTGTIDLLHTLAYKGMNIFHGYDANLPTQLWIMARYMQSVSLLIAPLFILRKLKHYPVLAGYTMATILLLLSVFYWNIFPDCYIEGTGLTPFKKISEYIISLILICSLGLLLRQRRLFDARVLRLIVVSIILTIAAELAFTLYVDVYGIANLLGHIFKVIAFWLIYRALIETGLNKPYDVLFRNLANSEARFRELFDNMSSGVALYEAINSGKDFIFKDINKAAERIDDVKREDIIGKSVVEIFPGVKDFGLFDVLHRVWQTGQPEHHPISVYHDQRISGWRENYVYKLPAGEIVAIYDDVTEHKKVEEALKIRAEILDKATDAIFLHDFEGNLIFVNETACRYLGYSREEIMSMKISQLGVPERVNLFPSRIREMREKGSITFERIFARKDGSLIPFEVHSSLIESEGRQLAISTLRDITERQKAEEELKIRAKLLDSASDSIVLHDFEGKFVYVNEAAYKSRGYSKEELMGMKIFQLIVPEYSELVKVHWQEITENGHAVFETAHIRKDGSIMQIETHARIIETGGRKLILGIMRDITERKQAEEEISIFSNAVAGATDAIAITDTKGTITYVNPAIEAMYGYKKGEMLGKSVISLGSNVEISNKLLSSMITTGNWDGEIESTKRNGETFSALLSLSTARDEKGNPIAMMGTIRDITERKKMEEYISQLAYHDPLTGLPNRSLLNDRFNLALAHARRYQHALALMMLDIDRFKEVNDTLGHNAGDKLLKEMADRLADVMRKTDTVSRMGGDEFVLLLSEANSAEDAVGVARKVLETINQPFMFDGHEFKVTTSIGIAFYPEDGDDIENLLRHADSAMYFVKQRGRNGYLRYTREMDIKPQR